MPFTLDLALPAALAQLCVGRIMSSRNRSTWIIGVGLAFFLAALVLRFALPNFVGSRPSKTLEIVQNLTRLEGAIQVWELDHGKTGVVPTQDDIMSYLRHTLKPVAGEQYIFRSIAEPPEAHLTRKVDGRQAGTVLRLNTNGGFDAVLPNQQSGANGKHPFSSNTNQVSAATASRRSP